MLSGATRPFLSAVMGARMAWRRFMGKEETTSRLVRREKTTMEVPKPSSGHGAPDATKPERDNRHADESTH